MNIENHMVMGSDGYVQYAPGGRKRIMRYLPTCSCPTPVPYKSVTEKYERCRTCSRRISTIKKDSK